MDEFNLLKHQKFFHRLFSSDIKCLTNEVFMFFSTGAGKTCASVLAAENYIKYIQTRNIEGYVYIISNKISKSNFIDTIINKCGIIATSYEYLKPSYYIDINEQEILMNQLVSGKIDEKMYDKQYKKKIYKVLEDNNYKFYTFQKFGNENILSTIKDFNNSLIIIDEAHSLLNENKFFQYFNIIKERSTNYRLILLSATPMINEPSNIVNFINILYRDKDKIKKEDIFTPNGINYDVIKEKFKNKVIYQTIYDPKNYPIQYDQGISPKGLLKYTKIIRCYMKGYQLKTYMKFQEDYIALRYIMNFCLPNDVYKLKDTKYKFSDTELKKYGIDILKNGISGNILLLENLEKYSTKYYTCLKNIIERHDGHKLVYSKFVYNNGIRLFAEILYMNGFEYYESTLIRPITRHYKTHEPYTEWIKKHKNETFIPAKFCILYNEISDTKKQLYLSVFNNKDNVDGHLCKIMLGSKIINESINIFRIRDLHILESQNNISRLTQIIGRGLRYNSHIDVKPEINIFKYVVSIKNGFTYEELEYKSDEENHIIIKKIERLLKTISINCNESKIDYPGHYKNTLLCDYQNCDYECAAPEYNFMELYGKQHKLMYTILYEDIEIPMIISDVRKIFKSHIIYNKKMLIDLLKSNDQHYSKYHIEIALNKMVEEKISVENRYGVLGFLQFISNNYIFHPDSMDENLYIPINLRLSGNKYNPGFIYDITNIVKNNINYKKLKKSSKFNIKKIYKNEDEFIDDINNVSEDVFIGLVEKAILSYKDDIHPTLFNILRYMKYYLIDKSMKGKFMYNRNFDEYFDKFAYKTIKCDTSRKFHGHILHGVPYILKKNKFVRESFDNIIDTQTTLEDNDFINGFVEMNDNNRLVFKLKYNNRVYGDKRKIQKGFNCMHINNKKSITHIYKKLGGKDINTTIYNYCQLIEKLLRKKQYESIGIRWFYDYYV